MQNILYILYNFFFSTKKDKSISAIPLPFLRFLSILSDAHRSIHDHFAHDAHHHKHDVHHSLI